MPRNPNAGISMRENECQILVILLVVLPGRIVFCNRSESFFGWSESYPRLLWNPGASDGVARKGTPLRWPVPKNEKAPGALGRCAMAKSRRPGHRTCFFQVHAGGQPLEDRNGSPVGFGLVDAKWCEHMAWTGKATSTCWFWVLNSLPAGTLSGEICAELQAISTYQDKCESKALLPKNLGL